MSCLKCGQEVVSGQIFCEACLADMQRHPVDPSTPIILPKRSRPLPSKRTHKRMLNTEDLITSQRRIIRLLMVIILLLLLLVGVLSYATIHYRNLASAPKTISVTAVENVSRETFFDSI